MVWNIFTYCKRDLLSPFPEKLIQRYLKDITFIYFSLPLSLFLSLISLSVYCISIEWRDQKIELAESHVYFLAVDFDRSCIKSNLQERMTSTLE